MSAPALGISAVHFLRLDPPEGPRLIGSRCLQCDAVFLGNRSICARCMTRERMDAIRLSERGTVYSFTIVFRSFNGVATPFVAAIVDLEGGGSLQGTLLDVDPVASAIAFNMPVKVIYRKTGQRNASGKAFYSYYFTPDSESEA